jgi:predicted Zn-dependent protease
VEGYRAAPDAKVAFQTLAGSLTEDERYEELRAVLEAHRERHADDPWLAYYRGQIHVHDKAWDKAVAAFGEAMNLAPKELRGTFSWQYNFAMYKAGRANRAYMESETRDRTFTQLADLFAEDKKGVELEALIETHRSLAIADPVVLYNHALAKV